MNQKPRPSLWVYIILSVRADTANDAQDIDESKLALYRFDESAGRWEKLSDGSEGVFGVDVNTTDVELYDNSYAGCVSATVSHLCLFGLAGRTFNSPPDVSGAHPSIEYLWPANHKFVDVTIEGVTDPDGDEVSITITGITSDENPCLPRAEKHTPDA